MPDQRTQHRITMASRSDTAPFWKTKLLAQMTPAEWESLCDGCGKCCMSKLIDDDTEETHFTTVACDLFDAGTCRCTDYANRAERMPDCVQLDAANVPTITWLPKTCAYRLVAEGRDLPQWHPLISGDPQSVARAGQSMTGRVTAHERDMEHLGEYLDHLVEDGL